MKKTVVRTPGPSSVEKRWTLKIVPRVSPPASAMAAQPLGAAGTGRAPFAPRRPGARLAGPRPPPRFAAIAPPPPPRLHRVRLAGDDLVLDDLAQGDEIRVVPGYPHEKVGVLARVSLRLFQGFGVDYVDL